MAIVVKTQQMLFDGLCTLVFYYYLLNVHFKYFFLEYSCINYRFQNIIKLNKCKINFYTKIINESFILKSCVHVNWAVLSNATTYINLFIQFKYSSRQLQRDLVTYIGIARAKILRERGTHGVNRRYHQVLNVQPRKVENSLNNAFLYVGRF